MQNIPQQKYEIIIVNDGSSDNTLEVAEKWAAEHRNIKVFSQENKGLSMARNFGAEKSEGKYIMFVDSDDHIAHDSLGEISAMCNDNPDMVRFCAANVIAAA